MMSRIKRRQFLQFAGSTLATLSFRDVWSYAPTDIQQQADRYGKVLAQTTPRKVALLVGINKYQARGQLTTLQGCVTDVELQRQLLIHRFGFNRNDIHTLTDAQATRQGILGAFDEYLIKQAKPGDVVVFHYSGHGSRVADPDKDQPDGLNSTFVPVDAQLPPGFPQQGGIVPDITGHTLFLLMSAVQSENLTVILDSCFSGGGTRGNFRIRSRDGGSQLEISPAEKAYQEQLLSRLNMSPQEFIKQRRAGVAKGVVIASAQPDQIAADTAFNGFYAGAFTYLMTQYLWQQTGQVGNAIANITRDIKPFSSQVPLADIKPQSGYERKPIYFIDKQISAAEAVITEVTGNTAKLWLGGLDRESLEAFDKGAVFAIVGGNQRGSGKVSLTSRKGLVGEATLEGTAAPGALLQEATRSVPSDLKLRIGLDLSLGGEINSAKQALQAINRVEAVPVPYSGEVHYLLSRVTAADGKASSSINRAIETTSTQKKPACPGFTTCDILPFRLGRTRSSSHNLQSRGNSFLSQEAQAQTLPAEGSIGLFSPGRDELIPDSFGEPGETVTKAISRLQAKLKSLLAVRLIKMTLNANSSRLKLAVSMLPEAGKDMIAEAFTPRSGTTRERAAGLSQRLNLGTPFQFRVTNEESRPLYLSILSVDPTRGLTVLFPHKWRGSDDVTRLDAGQTLLIPNPNQDEFQLVAQAKGIAEVLVVASVSPLKKSLKNLQSLAEELKLANGPVVLGRDAQHSEDSVDVIGNLLDDLSGERGLAAVGREVNTAEMAALSISFEVI
ncbi:MAG TPA: caspase family protein [Coleofasciculaceae cyanobacterium]|jgi:hypothetical protein